MTEEMPECHMPCDSCEMLEHAYGRAALACRVCASQGAFLARETRGVPPLVVRDAPEG